MKATIEIVMTMMIVVMALMAHMADRHGLQLHNPNHILLDMLIGRRTGDSVVVIVPEDQPRLEHTHGPRCPPMEDPEELCFGLHEHSGVAIPKHAEVLFLPRGQAAAAEGVELVLLQVDSGHCNQFHLTRTGASNKICTVVVVVE